jgi:ribosomal protein S27AE
MERRKWARLRRYQKKEARTRNTVCPKCGAQPGESCVGERGAFVPPHEERWEAAEPKESG